MDLKNKVKNAVNKFTHRNDQANGKFDFNPDDKERTSTAPTHDPISQGEGNQGQNQVWENENASMPDKSYAFDEDTTDAEYETEDGLEFEEDSGSGQESRYS